MSKRNLLMVLSIIVTLALATTGTLAYLSDTDSDVNVMTLGNVDILQNEQERRPDGLLDEFTQNQPAYPAVGPIEWADETITFGDHEFHVFTEDLKNVLDKFVTVTNTGKSDAYVRTIIVIEAPNYDPNDLIHVNVNDSVGVSATAWAPVDIDGVQYVYSVFTYEEALAPGETSVPSLMQLFLDSATTNEDVAAFGDTWEVLALSQAVQTQGFSSPETALNEAFGNVTAANLVEWLGKATIGSPGEENDTTNPPETLPTTSWQVEGQPDTSWYDASATSYTIDTASELAGLAKLVNEGTNFSKKTVTLGADIDLGEHQWTPIGNNSKKFQGTFDGNGKTISNLIVDMEPESYVGLFGYASGGAIKNVTVENAIVRGYLGVGVIAGCPFTSKVSGITITGDVQVDGYAYVGGVLGRNAYGAVSDVTVNVNEGSYVRATSFTDSTTNRTYVGGVIGFLGEGGTAVTNVTSNIDVKGSTCDVGGIAGIAHYGNIFTNCSSSGDVIIFAAEEENAELADEIGGIAGVWFNQDGYKVTLDGCSFTGTVSVNLDSVDVSDNTLVGSSYNTTGTGELIIK